MRIATRNREEKTHLPSTHARAGLEELMNTHNCNLAGKRGCLREREGGYREEQEMRKREKCKMKVVVVVVVVIGSRDRYSIRFPARAMVACTPRNISRSG